MNHQPPVHIDTDTVISAPPVAKQERRRASLATNRPETNTRPLSWVFIGAFSMPHSEHLIPFLN